MASLNFADLKLLNAAPQPKVVVYNEQEIEVRQWLPIADKLSIIDVTLQEAREGATYSPLKLQMFFTLNLVYKYTNLLFTQDERWNAEELYDKINTSGLLKLILEAIPADEKDSIFNYLMETLEVKVKNNTSLLGSFQALVELWPEATEKAMSMLENFDMDKFVEAQRFAQATNGGNPIPVGQK